MKQTWATFFERPHVAAALGPGATPVDRHLAWPIPARIDTATLSHGPVLFTGDAAAATDVMTGEGIGQALLTGRLAAAAIVAGGDVGRPVPRTPCAASWWPTIACRCSSAGCSVAAAAPTGRSPSSPTPANGAAATSPAGCSRTSPERSR